MRTTVASADIGDISFSFFSSASAFVRASFGMCARLDPLLHLLEVGALLALAELLLDRLHLLVQVVLALALLHLALDAAADALLDLQDVDLGLEQRQQAARGAA